MFHLVRYSIDGLVSSQKGNRVTRHFYIVIKKHHRIMESGSGIRAARPRRHKADFGRRPKPLQLTVFGQRRNCPRRQLHPVLAFAKPDAVAALGLYFPEGKFPQLESCFPAPAGKLLLHRSPQACRWAPSRSPGGEDQGAPTTGEHRDDCPTG